MNRVSLADRLAIVQGVRLTMTVTVLVSLTGARNVTKPGILIGISLAHLAATTVVELIRRRQRGGGLRVVQWLLFVDAVVLAVAIDWTGRHESPVLFLVYLHVTAVTVLLSYRLGLKIALWHGLLLYGSTTLALAGFSPGGTAVDTSAVAAVAGGFLIVALGAAWFSAVNERALRRSRAEFRTLADLGFALTRATTRDEALERLTDSLTSRLGFSRVAALVRNQEGSWAGAIVSADGATSTGSWSGADALITTVLQTNAVQLVRSLGEHDAPVLHSLLPDGQQVAIMPFLGAEPLLVAAEWRQADGQLSTQTLEAAVEATMNAGLALDNLRLLGEVEHMARHDALTTLANRRTFDERLAEELTRSARTGDPMSLVLIDIDHFKLVNDRHGHQTGDDVLRQVGEALHANERSGDLAARYGGEEFAIICPGCSATEALVVAERARARIARGVDACKVTASAGVATWPVAATSLEGLIAAGDEALYRAKRGGRDRVEAAPSMRNPRRDRRRAEADQQSKPRLRVVGGPAGN